MHVAHLNLCHPAPSGSGLSDDGDSSDPSGPGQSDDPEDRASPSGDPPAGSDSGESTSSGDESDELAGNSGRPSSRRSILLEEVNLLLNEQQFCTSAQTDVLC